jgi:hypothetical protein
MMSRTLTPLLAGVAAITLLTGAGAAFAHDPQEAARQAVEDSQVAADLAREQARETAREARETARKARDAAREAIGEARREVSIYRGGHDKGDVFVFRGGDREDHLRTMLQLRPNQEPALKAYLEAVGRGGGVRGDHVVHLDRRTGAQTTPERLAEMEAKLAEQQAAMRRRIDATKAFYGQLDDKQRKVFDSMPMLMFAGPGFGPMLLPVTHHMPAIPAPPAPPAPPVPPRL